MARRELLVLTIAAFALVSLAAPKSVLGGTPRIGFRAAHVSYGGYGGGFGGYGYGGGFYFPGFGGYLPQPAGSYLPPGWWAGQSSGDDPRQAGYNPSAGYSWDTVTALLLSTNPKDAGVTLDGTYIGTANYLGPIQLPMGKHTIKIEAPGYEPSETTLDVEKPAVQKLSILLGRAKQAALSPQP